MNQTQAFIAHVITVVGVVGSAIALAALHIIDGATAIAMIVAVTGISLGAVITTGGATVATNAQAASNPVLTAPGTTTTTTTAVTPVVVPTVATAPVVVPPAA